jgi:hypothetical protein
MSKIDFYEPFGHLQHKLCQKERPGVKLVIWLPTLKVGNRPNPSACRASATHHWKALDKGYNFASYLIVIRGLHKKLCAFKVAGVLVVRISRLPFGSPRTKSHLDMAPVESCRVYNMGEGGCFPRVQAVMSLVNPESPVACPSTKGAPESELTNLLVGWMHIWVSNWKLVTLPNPIPEPQHALLPLLMLRARNVP